MKLIDKNELLDELKKLKQNLSASPIVVMEDVKTLVESLDVKEVDLEPNSFDATVCKIGSVYLKEMDRDAIAKALEPYKNGDKVRVIIKAQKED
jgi:hypothetical protein